MGEEQRFSRIMTVAHIREPEGRDDVEVIFLESARFYRLSKNEPTFDETSTVLRDAAAKGRPVKVGLASISGDIIEYIHPAGSDSE